MWSDIQYALRNIAKKPLFYSVVILTIALGIGANAAIFTVVNGVLLQPLPYPHPERLMMVWTHNPRQGFDKDVGTYPNFEDWRRASQSFERMSAYRGASVTLTGSGDPAQIRGARVTHEFFETMGVAPLQGRAFSSVNGQAGGERVVIVAYGLWMRRLGADASIIGRRILLDGVPHEVIGVMPASFKHPADAELWMPLAPVGEFQALFGARGSYWLTIIGRLKPGVTRVAAQSEMDAIAGHLEKEHPSNAGIGIRLVTMREELVGDVKRPLLILLGAVCFVLLIACANVANLLLTRAASRQRELAIRAALGADRGRLVRQLLTESVVLGLLGGAAGLMLAALSTDLLQALAPAELPRLADITIDRQVLAYTAGASVFTSLLFGLVPALHASRRDSGGHLKEGGRTGTDGRRGGRVRAALAVGELAIALMLLVGAGLLIRSFIALNSEDPGFATRGVLALRFHLPAAVYGKPARITGFYEQLIERLDALPGVESAAAGSSLLLPRLPASASISIEGRPPLPADARNIPVPYDSVTPEYFSTLQIPLRRGRRFTRADGAQSQRVVMVNEAFARRFFPGEDPLGRRVTFEDPSQPGTRWQTIVGVVADTKRGGFEREPWAETYFPMRQSPDPQAFVLLRTTGDPVTLIAAAQAAVWSIDRNQAIASIRTVPELLAQRELNRRFTTLLLGVFASIALVLAITGTYGVIAHGTAQRTQEIGIRIALGADRRMILRMVLLGGLGIAATGLAIGVFGALALTHVLSGLLFGVSARDPLTFVVVPGALLVVALAACWIPARRAMQVEPVTALRGDS
ncbi:MAG TPA: ABC transporter permease [Vicinamibacterales bacterium]|nr:ABC transporter permease [Vicinamibacterales bacterium]